MFEAALFYTFSILAILAGISVITRRNAISSAVSLVASFFCLAAMYALLDAHFVAVIQILVYAGAIMVLFIFVIMVLNVREELEEGWDLTPRAIAGAGVGGVLGLTTLVALTAADGGPSAELHEGFGTIQQLGYLLFSGQYLLPFELVSALLTVAVVGAVVLAKKEL
ncbi:MAG: NADH-quinone oxidoreductase subunit J [Alphaproteobacteria bacterium]|nr:NADH-quinone oxidoreductase subunit J [Alphaproteobacteria bacterium]MCB9796375.1 NADH-quinone oxidoreductase subunit J [Alphaproteobacteria bacterium]